MIRGQRRKRALDETGGSWHVKDGVATFYSQAERDREYNQRVIEAALNCSLHNRFDIEIINAKTGEVKQRAQAENIILNALWTRLLAPNKYFNYIFYGTGSGTPAATDTALFTHLGYKSVTNPIYSFNWEEGYATLRQQCQLSEVEHVGSTLSEVGIGWGTSASNLVTHAMLKDMNGNTIAIAKTATDIINIYATVFVHWDTDGYDGGAISILHNSQTTNSPFLSYLLRGSTVPGLNYSLLTPGSNALASVSVYNSGSITRCFGTINSLSYSVPSKTITATMTRVPVESGNIGEIRTILICPYVSPSTYFDATSIRLRVGGSWYSETPIVGEAIGTGDGGTQDFKTAFGFAQPGAKIYVDAIEQVSGVTVGTDAPLAWNDMGRYFERLPEYSDNLTIPLIPWISNVTVEADTAVYYNPNYAFGILSYVASSAITTYVSNDLDTWISLGTGDKTVPEEYRNYKYWKFVNPTQSYRNLNTFTANTLTGYNVHFDTPPAVGAVITADYTTKTIAKDINHVFDFSLVITLAEKTT